MATATACYRYRDYTVAWICALPLEMAAAAAMLDERHLDLPARPKDSNTYILGRISGHKVAIACLPSGVYGTTSATTVATQMQSTFESIRFFMMVGIGGGVPSEKVDIRLGDVVVSKPTRDSGGVIQYDYGKKVAGGRFERTGMLNKPPPVLLTAVAKMQAEHVLERSRIPTILSEAVARNPRMKEKFAYRGEDQDLLFDSEYDHPEGNTCNNCDIQRLVIRPARASNDPVIHYGMIASGNQVVKHGHSRDSLAQDLDILCFEMEAAGLMDNFPCLVIRGICDYCDSHKNKHWQDYAAATAATYCKELLSMVHASHVEDTVPAGSIADVSCYKRKPLSEVKFPKSEIVQHDGQDVESLLERISGYNHEKVHQRLSGKRLAGTTRWLLNHPDFKAWFIEKRFPTLWCSGKIGSGKTMIATAVIEAAKYELGSPTVFFYCEGDGHAGLDVSSILSSLIKQLCEYLHRMHRPYPEGVAKEIRKFFGGKRVKPDFDDLKDIFTHLFHHTPDTIYVVDGVDALDQKHAKSLLELVRLLFIDTTPQQQSRILLLSRDQVPGYINMNTFIPGIRQISTSANVMQDIKTYIESSIIDKNICRRLTDDPVLIEKVRQRLLTESSGVFLWVYLQLEILWDTCFDDAAIHSALAKLPKSLEATYSRCIERINRKDSRVLKVLKWVSFATVPLHIEELREAVAFDLEDTAWSAEKIPRKEFVIGCCANLVVVDSTDDRVRFAHSSVRQYLEKERERNIIQGYPATEKGILECGEFCVAYLSFSDFSLQLSTRRIEKAAVPVQSPILFAQKTFPALLTRQFFQKPRDQKRSVSVLFHKIRTASAPDRAQYKFLDYAVANWALQTKKIHRTSLTWEKFERLAMCFNETWGFHPWVPGGRSASSHLHGLLGWAVMEQHEPLLSIARGEEPALQLICNLPLIGESLPALHVAAKLGYKDMIEILLDFCKVNAPDLEEYTALHHAAGKGHIEICQLLLSAKKIKVDALSKSQCTPLWLAASNGHEELVSLLTKKQADLEAKDASLHQTPLSRAARMGHDAIVELLLGKGAYLESQDADGRTPLSCAIEGCHETTIQFLLESGAKLHARDVNTLGLLPWASEKGYEGIVKLLCRNTADIDLVDRDGRTPLSWASWIGHESVVQLLLKNSADVEAGDRKWGRTPLSWAAENGHEAVVKMLLENGADLEAKDEIWGQTPLLRAVDHGHEAVVKLLLENGADVEVKDKEWGQTPLIRAAKNGYEAMVKILLEFGADVKTGDRNGGRTSFLSAVSSGHEAMVKVLLEHGADVEAKGEMWGQTPLLWAANSGHEAMVKVLLEHGADVEAKDAMWGQTPLVRAVNRGHEAVVKVLLENGADVEAGDNRWGRTPLLWAANSGHEAMVKVLLEHGADVEAKDEEWGQTPRLRAAKNGHEAVVKLLLRKSFSGSAQPGLGDCCGEEILYAKQTRPVGSQK